MSTKEKLIDRYKTLPSDFTFDELDRMLTHLGFVKSNKEKTSGSRIIYKYTDGTPIMIHKPHPGNIIKGYAMKQIYEVLKNRNIIK